MEKPKPCPYSEAEMARKLRVWHKVVKTPGLDELLLWAADALDHRPAPENKPPLDEIRGRLHSLAYKSAEWRHGEHSYVVDLPDIDDLFDELKPEEDAK